MDDPLSSWDRAGAPLDSLDGRFRMDCDSDPLTERPHVPLAASDASFLASFEEALRLRDEERNRLEREVYELRRQLRAIHTSSAWAALRTLTQIRESIAPRGGRRDRFARGGVNALRRLKRVVLGRLADLRARRAARTLTEVPIDPRAYPVVCLPIIEWSFRFQRPQHLMRRFGRAGHRVFYAANHFHRGDSARLRPIDPNVHEVILPGELTTNVYHEMPAEADVDRMIEAFHQLDQEQDLAGAVVIVQLPFWTPLAERLRDRFGWTIVYDCMDDHSGFFNNTEAVLEGEERLVAVADLVVASSEPLYHRLAFRAGGPTLLLRNACEYQAFGSVGSPRRGRGRRPLIGYYGAIAEWFDGELVAELARLRPSWRFALVGSTLAGDVSMLESRSNVRLLGERPYSELPSLIRDWDAFIVPFKRVPLTEATNPVKVYEMLATGKPVVAVGLPELVSMARSGLISLAHDAPSFARALDRALDEEDPSRSEARRAFARQNTWDSRHALLSGAIGKVRQTRVDSAHASRPPRSFEAAAPLPSDRLAARND